MGIDTSSIFCKKHASYNQLIDNTLSRNGPDQFNMEYLSSNVFPCKVICLPKIKDYIVMPKVLFQLKSFNASDSTTHSENRQLGKIMFIKNRCCLYWKNNR